MVSIARTTALVIGRRSSQRASTVGGSGAVPVPVWFRVAAVASAMKRLRFRYNDEGEEEFTREEDDGL